MIVRPRPNWLRMLFVWRGSIILRILPQLMVVTAISIIVVIFHGELLHWKVTLTTVPFSLVGVALAIFLGFRNSASYDRYWEARKLWGKLLVDSRGFTRQLISSNVPDALPLARAVAAFVHGTRHHLRRTDATAEMQRLLPPEVWPMLRDRRVPPMQVLAWLAARVASLREQGRIDSVQAVELDRSLGGLNEAFGGCERIAFTPLPFTYSVILHRTVYLYCLMLPFGLLDAIGFMTPLMVAFVAYTFFAIEALSDEIEDPFGVEPNDLPLLALSSGIEASVLELLGERDLPPVVEPVDHLLS
ncbi:bestrophin family ion channel [uncultured Aquabacterium sp.]|uniref:bestrophin family protein n=1 Tax=uncultured Aquabacterium sp. TaxID=158753 RepID=UPI002602C406|nr:bestrophin family ion channel [uncultured Aquabacterium sp.]